MTDAELLEQHRGGSETAFAELVRRHVNWVHSIAWRRLGDPHLAEDATQAAFVTLWRKAPRLKAGQALSPWLFPVVSFMCKRVQRIEHQRRQRESEAAQMREQVTENPSAQWDEMAPLLDDLVGRLGSGDRQALLLRFYEQKTFPEIGTAMRISEEAARKRVNRAVEKLRDKFARRGVAVTTAALTASISANASQPASAAVVAAVVTTAPSSIVPGLGVAMAWMSFKPVAAIALAVGLAVTMGITLLQVSNPAGPAATAVAGSPATLPAATQPSEDRYGRVLSPDGKPIAGARVWQTESGDDRQIHVLASATSNEQGVFRIPKVGKYRPGLLVYAQGFGLTDSTIADTSADEPYEIQLAPPTTLRMQLLGPDKQPVSGLKVVMLSLRTRHGANFAGDVRDMFTVTTDQNGGLTIPNLPQNGTARFEVLDDRFAALTYREEMKLAEASATEGPTLQLKQAATISGRITYADSGKPAVGVKVYARATGDGIGYADTVSDANGNYRLTRVGAAEYGIFLWLDPEVNKHHTTAARQKVRVLPGMNLEDQNFSMISGATIRGKITNKSTGEPLAGVSVMVMGPAHPRDVNFSQDSVSGPDGTYISHVPPGKQYVQFGLPTPMGMLRPDPLSYEPELADGETVTLDFAVPVDPTPAVKGRVVNEQGQPVPGASVLVARQGSNEGPEGALRATTDSTGSFNIPAVEGTSLLRARKGRLTTIEPTQVGTNRSDIKLVLYSGAQTSIRMRVVDQDGKPVTGIEVGLLGGSSSERPNAIVDDQRKTVNGEYIFKSVAPDLYYLTQAFGKGYSTTMGNPFRIEAGKINEPPPIVVYRADSFVAGMVLGADGQPAVGIEVRSAGRRSSGSSARTDVNGMFRIVNIVPGEDIRISIPGKMGLDQTAPAGTDNIVINLQP